MNIALKEWNLVIDNMLAGKQTVLLRKGGILEAENEFQLEHPQFLFYPTFIHQDPKMVKPACLPAQLPMVREEPENIELKGYGQVAHIFEVPSRPQLEQLDDLHLFGPALLDMRFAYRPDKPLYVVAVRAFWLAQPITIPNTLDYAGCKSWVPLRDEIPVEGATPAVPNNDFNAILERIGRTFDAR